MKVEQSWVLVSTHGVRIRLHGHVVPLRRTWSFLLALVYDSCILIFYSISIFSVYIIHK
jgi:hypothetical protein